MAGQSGSFFNDVQMAPPIEVFALIDRFKKDEHPKKVNLSVGAYRTEEGKPWVLPVVKVAEVAMVSDPTLNHEYLPVAGLEDFRDASCKLLLGADSPAIVENRTQGVQCLGGTGAIRLAAEFLKRVLKFDTVFVSKPTWGNHKGVFKAAGFSSIKEYRYWNDANKNLDLEGMLQDLKNAPEKSAVILHACAHNPTGVDPTREQWKLIADVLEAKKIFVLIDCAYQGFASGNIDNDAFAPRYFAERGFEFFTAQSFSKNFGLYNERTGNLCVVNRSPEMKAQVKSQLEIIVRTMWSNPPNHGARIVASVLNNNSQFNDWKENVKTMANRILNNRKLLYDKLRAKGTPGTWDHIINQIGMFSFTGLGPRQVTHLIDNYHIYLMKEGGRINMCAITSKNVDYVVEAIHDAITTVPKT
ncbi:aspartate aminotransferase, cytoplasmic-like [Gigantopelta aegis]|uniref:aspartate aminotransferase, cytoplasmic-like n=1 Tax=Gigantopelta aegis TaxID=1735272 RepID=UPI001B88DBC1|nr:aspartate aminotransferase, cytoplasmic-like [Gigantopelta aegis]